ncbi:defensin alpha 5-like [Desmodus rotundus]|uniref:defensin alpha 5-like n=1 Tax=Desmodus rotundus TaxID=9430 RepID=UPI000D183AAD|nr:defensin alpha 5-like [Desmodus rotundus]
MRTFALLAALLLLAFQAKAQTLQETADQVLTQDQPGVEDQDQPGDKDQDVAISFTREGRFAPGAAGPRKTIYCSCRLGGCQFPDRPSGTCQISGILYTLCCH